MRATGAGFRHVAENRAVFHVSLDYLLGNDEDTAEDIVDFNHFILHGNYTIDAHFPEESERKMIHDLVRAVYDNQRK